MIKKNNGQNRLNNIDLLKGISIIAVLLYHMGILKSGYLGVDCFFVISGFLTIPRIFKEVENDRFRIIEYLRGKLVRLLPAILIAAVVSLVLGYFFWLPDDYENLAESVIATVFFSNNILAGMTVKNYWDSINEYKPLMHMWYVGILMEYYIITSIIAKVSRKISVTIHKDTRRVLIAGLGMAMACSFVLFLVPCFTASDKFYFIPFRFWELAIGGFAGVFKADLNRWVRKCAPLFSMVAFVIFLFTISIGLVNYDYSQVGVSTTIIGADDVASSNLILPNGMLLFITAIFACVFIITDNNNSLFNRSKILSAIGRRSYSIFVWHQVMLALYRYSITNRVTPFFVVCFLCLLIVVCELNYRIIETKTRDNGRTVFVIIFVLTLTCIYSSIIFLRAGVVRNVPELGITTNNIKRNMHSSYCDRIYSYKEEFVDDGKINVLVVGNSFARDWCNIMLESDYCDRIHLYFSVHFDDGLINKIRTADRIFVFENFEDKVPEYVWENANRDIVYCIGTKNFGISNGPIYFNRFSDDYFSQTVTLDPGYEALNNKRKEEWRDHYIDLIEPVLNADGRIRVFTDDKMFISQDCRHLTEAGAKYYARIMDFASLLQK